MNIIKKIIYSFREYKPLYVGNRVSSFTGLLTERGESRYVIGYKYPWENTWKVLDYNTEYIELEDAMSYIKENFYDTY